MTTISQTDQAVSKLLDLTEELIKLHKLDEAEKFLDEILKYKPDDLNVPFQRGTICAARGQHEESLEQFMIVHRKMPRLFENLNNIATAYYNLRKYDDGVFYYKKALEIEPEADYVMAALATCFFRRGKLDEAVDYFRKALAISPERTTVHSDLLLAMIYAESVSPEHLAEEAGLFGKNIAAIFPENAEFKNDKSTDRKIRIGYISPDFRDHPVPYFLEPVLQHHDKDKFEVYAYSTTLYDNPVMERLKTCVEVWRDVRSLKVEEIYNVLLEDRIDILVDVTGHTAHNNLAVFAKKAAPVQVTWLGYPATTGMKAMDYRITDSYAEPEGMTEHLNTETLCRLPHIFCVYQAPENIPAVISRPPSEDNGHITFGCFNNFIKVRDPVLDAWSKILERVPRSRLLLEIDGIDDAEFRKSIFKRLKKHNIPIDRITLEPRKRSNQFVLYNKIDIALDPFPCVGGTTSMDALWMGVPFVTMAGKSFVSRMGVSILTNTGLSELIARTVDEYVTLVANLANDADKLKGMRHNLRDRFEKSPAMDQRLFTHNLEDAYRKMWTDYCKKEVTQ